MNDTRDIMSCNNSQLNSVSNKFSRRHWLGTTGSLLGTVALGAFSPGPLFAQPATEKKYKKAVKIGMVRIKGDLQTKFQTLKDLGFDGVELDSPGGPSADEVLRIVDATGLPVHGVVDSVHWKDCLSDPSEEVRTRGREALETAIRDSKAYGGTSVLLVPGKCTTDVSYDQAWERSIPEIKKVIPLAEELNIRILIENVWNNFLTQPEQMADFVDACGSPIVGAYYDIGNSIRYASPVKWVQVLGKRIGKLDIKDFSLEIAKKDGEYAGFRADLLDGSVPWPEVMDELEKIGYTGWGTAEIPGGDRERLEVIAERMDKIFAS